MTIDGLDDSMDKLVALPADDAVAVLADFVDYVNSIERASFDQRLLVVEMVVDALNRACRRRARRTLQ